MENMDVVLLNYVVDHHYYVIFVQLCIFSDVDGHVELINECCVAVLLWFYTVDTQVN